MNRFVDKYRQKTIQCIDEVKTFGFHIGVINFLYPILIRSPHLLAGPIIEKKHAVILKHLLDNYSEIIEKYRTQSDKSIYQPDSPIWVCWLQGETNIPEVPRQCLKLIRKNTNQHNVVFIDDKNFGEYISIPDYIIEKYHNKRICNAHFSDVLRTVLLAEHGGCWIDSTILMTKELDNSIFQQPFYSIKCPTSNFYVTKNVWCNFFMAGWKNSIVFQFVKEMLIEYIRREEIFIDYFLMDYIIKTGYDQIPEIKSLIDQVPINNAGTLKIKNILNDAYDESSIEKYKIDSYLFKLDWREEYNTHKNKEITNWNYLIS